MHARHSQKRRISGCRGVTGRSVEINILEAFRRGPVFWRDFKHDIVLVELGIDEGNLRLAELGVERGIERACRQSQPRGSHPVVSNVLIEAAILLVGADILKAWQT